MPQLSGMDSPVANTTKLIRPWQLPGWELPHHALPLPSGRWRAPLLGGSEAGAVPGSSGIEAAIPGLRLEQRRADGAGAYRVDWEVLTTTFAGWSASQFAALHPQSAAWVAARVFVGAHAWLQFPTAPQWMVILNLTPDSFSDGGKWLGSGGQLNSGALQAQAQAAVAAGASWLDLGAESTRPGAAEVSAQQQLDRLLPAIEVLQPVVAATHAGISIDTRNADVAAACLSAGAGMINDVSGFGDSDMAKVCARADCPTVLMHMRGTPATMQQHCEYSDLIGQIADEMAASVIKGLRAGLSGNRILLDPGIGFSKTAAQNYELIAHSDAFRALGFPLLLGPSRKSFLTAMFPEQAAAHRDVASAGAAATCAHLGAQILRLHNGEYWPGILVAARLGKTRIQQAHPYNDCAETHC